MTRDAIAKEAGIDPGQLTKLLKGPKVQGGIKEPGAATIFALCRVLELDPHYVWWGEPMGRRSGSSAPPSH